MRITMISFGSTGDVRPYIVLARELKRRGHDVAVCAFPEFEKEILSNGFRFFPIKGNLMNFMNHVVASSNGATYLKNLIDNFKPHIYEMLDSIDAACQDAEAMISCFFGEIFKAIAEARHIPYIQTQLFIMDPNSEIPVSVVPCDIGKPLNYLSYHACYMLLSMVDILYLSKWRREHGAPQRKLSGKPIGEINGHPVPVLYLMSPLVVPRPRGWGENIHMTGFLYERQENEYIPSPELNAFLSVEPEHTVYIGFGSMVTDDFEEGLNIVLDSVSQAGVRAVISKGWGGVKIQPRENIFVVDFVPHDWLFRHVAAVVHHCGAGTTAAGILAGKPTLAVPFGSDQPFWAERIYRLGIGPKSIPYKHLTVKRFSAALRELVSNKRYWVAAKELGARLSMEQGETIAADLIEQELRKWFAAEESPIDSNR